MFSFYKVIQDDDIYLHFVNENLISEFQISKITFITENSGFGSFNITTENQMFWNYTQPVLVINQNWQQSLCIYTLNKKCFYKKKKAF